MFGAFEEKKVKRISGSYGLFKIEKTKTTRN